MDFAKASEILKSALEQAQSLKRNWLISISKGKLAMSIIEMVKQEKMPSYRLNELRESELHLGNAMGSASSIINGEIEFYFGNMDEAINQVKQAYLLAEEKQAQHVNVSILELHLRILLKLGEFDDVIRLADDGISKSMEMGYIPMLWRIHLSKAQAFEKLNRLEEAKQEYKASAEIIKRLAENISEEEFRQSFMSNPLVSLVVNKTNIGS
jgi:tetratricopeptide (TPR) repeat protein